MLQSIRRATARYLLLYNYSALCVVLFSPE